MRISSKQLLLLLLISFFWTISQAQDSSAIKGWAVESKKLGAGRYELIFSVPVSNGWQLYAPNQLLLDVKTTELKFTDSSIIQEGDFILLSEPKKITSSIFEGALVNVFETNTSWKAIISIKGDAPAKLQVTMFYTYGKNDEFYPSTLETFTVPLEGGVEATSIKIPSINITAPVNNCGDEGTKNKSLIAIFLLGLVGGLIALITPCVFPMIPVTVTFFTKRSGTRKTGIRNAILYGLFIFFIYILITLPFHVAGKAISPEIFNNISTNVWLNLLFFGVFVFFALSFFGLFEIGLPAGLANRADSRSGLGNLGGIFFMAGTLAIVSFSCTGPILGTLLVGVADQGAWPLTVGAAGFGLALGLPFALFAMFPHWLQSLPKSGGWMTDVKVVLGFLELALAVKFFSNADLVKQWGLLKREIFIGLWVLIGILIVLYLLGKLKVGHSSPIKKFSFVRIASIILFSAITIYFVPGLTNSKAADLRLISGFPPPRTYSIYTVKTGRAGIYDPIHNDYKKAVQLAKEQGKPVLIDFTGWACVNCRRMEDKVWKDDTVDSLFRTKFIVVSLYVDEKKKLPVPEQTVEKLSNGTEKSIVTVGDKWATFQIENFGATSQPQYAIISPDEKALTKTKFYTPNAAKFIQWLECGLDAFEKSKK
ncbi:MAG TPA: thioredoxin family protein [Chitinophagaceae bacterium]|nr:thioredoxin family protein [Chitinophagaceae bacterium]